MKLTVVSSVVATAAIATAYTAAEITAMTIAIGALITAIFTGIVNIIAQVQQKKQAAVTTQKVEENTVLTTAVDRKMAVVETHVNGMATAQAARIEILQKENDLLRAAVADKKETAALLAQAVVLGGPGGGSGPPPKEVR